jgi:hypothetical protein
LDNLAMALYTSGITFVILFGMSAVVALVIKLIHKVASRTSGQQGGQ